MSRSGFVEWDDCDQQGILSYGRTRGQVASATRGKRGQRLLRLLAEALDAIPIRQLGSDSLVEQSGCYCTMGAAYAFTGKPLPIEDDADLEHWETAEYCRDSASADFDVAEVLIQEIMWENDECVRAKPGEVPARTRQRRWESMRAWVQRRIRDLPPQHTKAGGDK